MRQDHQGLTKIPLNLLHQLMPTLLETMMIMACPSYSALIVLQTISIRLGNSGGGQQFMLDEEDECSNDEEYIDGFEQDDEYVMPGAEPE